MKEVEITYLPDGKKIKVRPGSTLLDAGRKAGVAIRTHCGGRAACLMCKVQVPDQSGVSRPNGNERNKLGSLLRGGTRLACQTRAMANVAVIVPEDPLKAAIRKQLEMQKNGEDDWI